MAAAMGVTTKLGMGSANPVDTAFEFIRDGLMLTETIADLGGIKGTRSRSKERSRVVSQAVGGTIVMNPNPVELAWMLPRILGEPASGTTFALAETLPEFYVTSDRSTKVLTYAGCKVNRGVFRAGVGGPLEVSIDVVGKTETVGNSGTFPSLTYDQTSLPFILSDLALVIGGTTYTTDQVELIVDNMLEVRFGNSLTATSVVATDRMVSLNTRIPWGDGGSVLGSGDAGLATTLTFTNGTVSILFSLAAFEFPKMSPVVDGRGEMWLPINGIARKSSSTDELVVTLDSTP